MGSENASCAFLRSSAWASPYLWVTGCADVSAPEGAEVLRVTRLADVPGTADPKRLGGLHDAVVAFLDRHPGALVLVDCLDPLVMHNGVERVERALADLHDGILVRGGTLVVFIDASVANPRLVAWLERELDPMPATVRSGAEADTLLA